MDYNDWMGTIGVGLVLLAYFFNTMKMIPVNGKLFFVLNVAGGALSCYAAVLINFIPFVVLEGIWTVVSVYGFAKQKSL
jgi:hypothetical protein